jgi:hypothetical protein
MGGGGDLGKALRSTPLVSQILAVPSEEADTKKDWSLGTARRFTAAVCSNIIETTVFSFGLQGWLAIASPTTEVSSASTNILRRGQNREKGEGDL